MNTTESKYVEKKSYLARLAHPRELAVREDARHLEAEFGSEAEWLRTVKEDLPKFIPFLRASGLEFRGRVLEIGAGAAWLSAELSKLPKVVEVVATDFSPKLLKEKAPKIFKMLQAHEGKITRMPADFHKLDFPDNYFDFVVCSAVLHHAVSPGMVLREAKRVLKPGGKLAAIREPVWPLMKLKSRSRGGAKSKLRDPKRPLHTLAEYRELFDRAGFALEVKRVNLAGGLRYYFDKLVNGLTHARYAFIATKKSRS